MDAACLANNAALLSGPIATIVTRLTRVVAGATAPRVIKGSKLS